MLVSQSDQALVVEIAAAVSVSVQMESHLYISDTLNVFIAAFQR